MQSILCPLYVSAAGYRFCTSDGMETKFQEIVLLCLVSFLLYHPGWYLENVFGLNSFVGGGSIF